MVDNKNRTRDRFGRDLWWRLVLCAVLIAGCIKPSSDFPYQASQEPDTAPSDADATDADEPRDAADTDAACQPESDDELCSIEGVGCGAIQTTDRCGDVREVAECGTCPDGEVCTDNTCCELTALDELCEDFCGDVTLRDENCGVQREVNCPDDCPANRPCEGTTCGTCEPETDPMELCDEGVNCGTAELSDQCGGTVEVDCGDCPFEAQSCIAGKCECAANNENVNCEDGVDNDCDGETDCEDANCAGHKCGETILNMDKFCLADGSCK